VALTDLMRLSFRERRTRHLVQCCVAGNPGRDDKEKGDASMESSYWREGVFITLGGPQALRENRRDQLTRVVKPRDLIRVHFFADLQHEMRGCFFEICSRLGDTIDLGEEGGFIERLSVTEGFHL
jgi:hypothetical protein